MLIRRIINNPVLYRNPFAELDRIRKEMDMLTGSFFGQPPQAAFTSGVFPALNLTEDSDHYYIRAELPGLKADQIDIQATGKSISISGERKFDPEKEGAKYHRREREGGRFSRILDLPGDIDSEKVEAGLANGILTIKISKAEVAKPRQINIK